MLKSNSWSPLAVTDFENILNYLNENWDEKVVLRFIKETETLLFNISKQPKQFPLVNKKIKVCKCVISKHNTLFYQENKEYIALLRIFDTRQNPKKSKIK